MIPSMHFSGPLPVCQILDNKAVAGGSWDIPKVFIRYRVAELGSLSSGAKMAMKIFGYNSSILICSQIYLFLAENFMLWEINP